MKSNKIPTFFSIAVACLLLKAALVTSADNKERYRTALNLLGSKQYEEALPLLKKVIENQPSFPLSYQKLFFAYKVLNKLDEAAQYFRAIHPQSGLNLWGLGLIEQQLGNVNGAINYFKQAISRNPDCLYIYESLGIAFIQGDQTEAGQVYFDNIVSKQPDNAAAWYGLANWYRLRREWDKAITSAQRAIASDSTFYKAYYLSGWVYQRVSEYDKAVDLLKKGEQFARAQGDFEQHAKFLRLLGVVEGLQGDIETALSYAGSALDVFKTIGDKKWIETILGDLGMQYYELGDYTSAETHLRQAYQIAVEIDDIRDQARHLNNLGILFRNTGKYPEAMDIFSQALQLYRDFGDKRGEGLLLSNYAEVYYDLGMLENAVEFQQAALNLSRKSGDKRSESIHLINLGIYFFAMADESQALQFLQQALAKSREIGYKKVETSALESLGTWYAKKGDPEKAKLYLIQALHLAQNIKEKRHESMILNSLGWFYYENKNHQVSKEYFQKAITLAEDVGDLNTRKAGHTGIAMLLEEQGEYEKALGYYRSGAELVENTRAQLDTDIYRLNYFAKEVNVYERIVALLGKMHEQDPAKGYEVQALQYAERAMARSLLDILDRGNIWQHLDHVPRESKQKLLFIRHTLNQKHMALSEELTKSDVDTEKVVALRNEVEQLERERSKIEIAVNAFGSKSTQPGAYDVLSVPQVQQELIGKNQVFLKYMFAGDSGFLWLITKDHLYSQKLSLTRTSLDSLLAIISPVFGGDDDTVFAAGLDHRVANFKPKVLHELCLVLLPPSIHKYLENAKELIILPDYALLHFPFEILVTRIKAGRIHYLVEDHAISYAPSLSFLQQNLRRESDASKSLLAVGNPDYTDEQEQDFIDWLQTLDALKIVFRGNSFRDLPNAAKEVRTIGRLFGDSTVLTGVEANEAAFKEQVGQYKYIHIATHFISNEKQPLYSKIVFAQTDKGNDDGFLQPYEIYNMNLNATMVVLSGCNTGRGKFRKGEGLLGVARAFQYAGVPTLVASLWPVEDESTAFLMERFYGYLMQGFGKNQALRRAKLDMIQADDKKRDPFYWGAFVLLGNWR